MKKFLTFPSLFRYHFSVTFERRIIFSKMSSSVYAMHIYICISDFLYFFFLLKVYFPFFMLPMIRYERFAAFFFCAIGDEHKLSFQCSASHLLSHNCSTDISHLEHLPLPLCSLTYTHRSFDMYGKRRNKKHVKK